MVIVTKQGSNGKWFYQLYPCFGGKLVGYSQALWPSKQHAKLAGSSALNVTWVKSKLA